MYGNIKGETICKLLNLKVVLHDGENSLLCVCPSLRFVLALVAVEFVAKVANVVADRREQIVDRPCKQPRAEHDPDLVLDKAVALPVLWCLRPHKRPHHFALGILYFGTVALLN